MLYRITCNSFSRSEQFPFCSLDLSGYINKFRGISKSKSPNSSAEHRPKGSCPNQNTFLLCFLFCFGIFCFTSLSFLKVCLIFLFSPLSFFWERVTNGSEEGKGPETESGEHKIGWAGSWAGYGRSREKRKKWSKYKNIKLKKIYLSALLRLKWRFKNGFYQTFNIANLFTYDYVDLFLLNVLNLLNLLYKMWVTIVVKPFWSFSFLTIFTKDFTQFGCLDQLMYLTFLVK